MAQQTVVEWLVMTYHQRQGYIRFEDIDKAKEMELEQRKEDFKIGYNQGYLDAQCNHINDADNFASEQEYLNNLNK